MKYKIGSYLSIVLFLFITTTVSSCTENEVKTDTDVIAKPDTDAVKNNKNVNPNPPGNMKVIELTRLNIYALGSSNFAVLNKSNHVKTTTKIRYNKTDFFKVEQIIAEPGEIFMLTLKGIKENPTGNTLLNWVLVDEVLTGKIENRQPDKDISQLITENSSHVIDRVYNLPHNEKITINFTAPEKKGRYLFLGTNKHHFENGMKGYLKVQ